MSTVALPVVSLEGSLSRYLDEINKFPYLTPEEEYGLAKNWVENGDVSAAHHLVTSHLRLVAKIAMSFRNYGLPIVELISEGNIGLMQAVKKFDHTKGFRLSTYAIWWIKASIQEYILRSWSLVKMGTTAAQKKLFFNLKRLKGNLTKVDDTALSPKEVAYIAHELEVSEQEVREMDSRMMQSDASLNAPVLFHDEGSGSELQDYVAQEGADQEALLLEFDETEHRHGLLMDALSSLNEREQDILKARRLKETPETLEELSHKFGVSRERVRQIEARAMEKLQQIMLQKVAV
jgi:RNA polymerase sigma-32 factor